MYKKCSKCKEQKLFSEFCRNKARKDGYNNNCKVCAKEYQQLDTISLRLYLQEYRKVNKHRLSENKQKYYELNKDKILNEVKEYKKRNRAKYNAHTAKRKAIKLQATPDWLTKDQLREIEEFYKKSQRLKAETGEEYHVDHIVPLQGENVCGLHVPWNLQVIKAEENLHKSNKLLED